MRRWCRRGRNRIHGEESRSCSRNSDNLLRRPQCNCFASRSCPWCRWSWRRQCCSSWGIVDGGVGEVAGWVYCAIQNVDYTVTNFLAGEMGGDNGGNIFVVGPGHGVDAAGVSDDDGVIASNCNGGNDGVAVGVHVVRGADVALGDVDYQEDQADLWHEVKCGDRPGSNGITGDVSDQCFIL